jgi:Fur family zinc uptake transcriptional regulator
VPEITLDDVLKQLGDAPMSAELESASPSKPRRPSARPRRVVFAILREAQSPLRAYEILQRMSERTGRKVAPPTVYRALDFLIDRRLVSRIESRNAFVCVASGMSRRSHAFFICGVCGSSKHASSRAVEDMLVDNARAIGFEIDKAVIELHGTCANCRPAVSLAPSA